MTRSIPSVIVLTLMCFTISYGLVRFPNAGILDAAQNPISATDSLTTSRTSLKPLIDGSALQVNEPSTTLEEPQPKPEDLFVTQPTTAPVEDAADTKPEIDAADNNASNQPENKKASDNKKKKSNGKKSNKKPVEPEVNESEKPKPESEPVNEPEQPVNKSEEPQDDSAGLIGIPNGDLAEHDDSMPIPTDQDPLPNLDNADADIPPIFVDNNFPESDLGPLSEPEPVKQDEPPMPELSPEEEKSIDDYWETIIGESSQSNKDNPQTDSAASSEPEKKTPTTAPTEIKTDPNAQEIPPRNRETKPANQDALTLPALDEPQNDNPNPNQPDTGTIPMESFPLDASAMQKANYTVDYQQEPYDPFGFNVPETGEIIVKRLPPIENSVDPIYNNAQLDRFAL